jgi:steroid delta-isomerase
MSTYESLVEQHVHAFNEGVRSGDFVPMLDGFTDDAVLTFKGITLGPFEGKEAIAAAYRAQAPDDEIELLGVHEAGDRIQADYAWRHHPTQRAGQMLFKIQDGAIIDLLIVYEG